MNIKIKGIYKHFKGDYYIVEDIAYDSETNQKFVVYRQLYGDTNLYIRKEDVFLSPVDVLKYPNSTQKYRFQLENIKSCNNHSYWTNFLKYLSVHERRDVLWL